MSLLQQPVALPRPLKSPHRMVSICHPGYETYSEILLLRTLDDGGIDYDLVLTACGIIAGNRWDGYLCTHEGDLGPKGKYTRVDRPADGILRGPTFYFQLPEYADIDQAYPVITRFDDWPFPHNDLPPVWRDCVGLRPDEVLADGVQCRITDARWCTELVRVVRADLKSWFERERMQRYVVIGCALSPVSAVVSWPLWGSRLGADRDLATPCGPHAPRTRCVFPRT